MDKVFDEKDNIERECELTNYPPVCDCVNGEKLICSNKGLTEVPSVPPNTSHLILMNNQIHDIPLTAFDGLTNLKVLYLSENPISTLRAGVFRDLINLEWLFLVNNTLRSLDEIHSLVFVRCTGLLQLLRSAPKTTTESGVTMHFDVAKLNSISPWVICGNLQGLMVSTYLESYGIKVERRLNSNLLEDLSDGTPFRHMQELKWCIFRDKADADADGVYMMSKRSQQQQNTYNLERSLLGAGQSNCVESDIKQPFLCTEGTIQSLSFNPIQLDELSFSGFHNLKEIDLVGVDIPNINNAMFEQINSLTILHFERFEYCKFAHHVRNCNPKTDGISSTENLLEGAILRISVWTIALLTTCGNLNVFISRIAIHAENKVHSIVVSNLCAADFMMGLYLFAIGIQDARFRNNYIDYALDWSESWGCHFVGFLALLSTEASVLTLTFISLERFFIVAFPYRFHRLNIKEVVSVLILIWIVAFVLAASPLIFTEYFKNFYGANGVCFPLHIHDPRLEGWEYSIFIFLGINTFSFMVIIFSYCGMFQSIQKTRKRTTTLLPGDINYAKRFFFIVLTDCICWLPLAVVKVLAVADMPVSESIYAWVVIFILPINSALNPILYTLSTGPFRRVLLQKIKNRGKHTETGAIPKNERFSNGTNDTAGETLRLQSNLTMMGGNKHEANKTMAENTC
ncbi:putative relaxin receptor 2-like isoform X2 [Apostichopus japonicus]|uniref:Putative relaxin receptor 2-like isoform X2 n=1 Tax=Stichopus japonicus TaxID=307972 RepID=A0A2G8JUJ6_STIJA|nr:putative relaxin receptor 2-like isoform X2 [Apostichopus japonicus]